jgi:transcriptional regulator with XRE-family HTH domain
VEKNVSETELAERLGVKRPYLNAVACGKKNITLTQLERIAEALGMSLHICFEEVSEP